MKNNGCIICIVDGMAGDNLEVLVCKYFNEIIKNDSYGFVDSTPKGHEPDSLLCILNILGVPKNLISNKSRAYFEATGVNIKLKKNDLIFRASWVSLDENKKVLGFLQNSPEKIIKNSFVNYFHLEKYKSILIMENKKSLINKISTFKPHKNFNKNYEDIMPIYPEELYHFCVLNTTYNQGIIPWSESVYSNLPKLNIKTAFVSGIHLLNGISKSINGFSFTDRSFTGDTDTNLLGKINKALELSKSHNLVVLHINGGDEASHRKNKREKKEFLKKVDEIVFKKLNNSPNDFLICSDHGTSYNSGEHLLGENIFAFRSKNCKGNLGIVNGNDLLKIILGNKTKIYKD